MVLELGCSSAGKAVLEAGEDLDQVVIEVAVIGLAAPQVLGLAASALVVDQVVSVALVAVHRKCYHPVEEAEDKEQHKDLYLEGHRAMQQRQCPV